MFSMEEKGREALFFPGRNPAFHSVACASP
jgi:hypothetical protein